MIIITIMLILTKGNASIKQILMDLKGDMVSNTVLVGDFNTPLTSMDRSSRQKNQQGNSSFK